MSVPTECRYCGRPIVWAKSASGKAVPLEFFNGNIFHVVDPETVDAENLADEAPGFTLTDVAVIRRKRGRLAVRTVDGWYAINHFITCPNRDQVRQERSTHEPPKTT